MRSVDAAGLGIGDEYPPRIMGVLNVSAESPYSPSVFDDPGAAAEYVDEELIGSGADIVDVGLESANKRFEVLSAEAELDRLDVAVEAMESVSGDAVFSIETRYHEVADEALSRGFDIVNDICGFADPEMPRVCEAHDAAVVKMASPPDLRRPGAVEAGDWATHRAVEATPDAGVDAESAGYVDDIYAALAQNGFTEKTILDPAFGGWSEAQTLDNDRETFRRLREFRGYGRPILVSINRKNFLRDVAGRSTEEALPVSLAATSMAVERGAHVIRTHDVAATRDAALIGATFARDRVRSGGDVTVEELDVTTPREAARHVERVGGDVRAGNVGVVRSFELRRLGPEDRRAVRAATLGTDATVATGEESGTALLFGTPAALDAVCDAALGVSAELDAAVETIREALV